MRIQFIIFNFIPLLIGLVIGYFGFMFLFIEDPNDLKINYKSMLKEIAVSNEARFMNIKKLDKEASKILCIIVISPNTFQKSVAGIASSWGEKCSGLKFITTKKPEFSKWSENRTIVIEQWFSSRHSWRLIRKIWKLVHEEWLNDYNWFFLIEENSFIIMENLNLLLSRRNFSEPKYYGHMLRKSEFKYIYNVPGYVLSKEALRRLGQKLNAPEASWWIDSCASTNSMTEISWVLGKCLASVDVEPIDTRDSEGRLMFLPLPITYLMNLQNQRIMRSVQNLMWVSDKKFDQGLHCCSDVGIAFTESHNSGRITIERIHMNYMTYRLKPVGIEHEQITST